MNAIPSVSRACTRKTIPLRPRIPHNHLTQPRPHTHQVRAISISKLRSSSVQPQDELSPSQPTPFPSTKSTLHSPTITTPSSPASPPLDHPAAKSTATTATRHPKLLTGTITRTGTMQSCIQITHQRQMYDSHLQKHYSRPTRLLVHDPHPPGYLRAGDVIEYSAWSSEEKAARSQRKEDVLAEIAQDQAQRDASGVKKVRRQGRRFMTERKRTGNHGTGEPKWVGPRYVVRRVVTPFGIALDQRGLDASVGGGSSGGSGTN